MVELTRAHKELFRRTPDECFRSFDSLYQRCALDRERSTDRWIRPEELNITSTLALSLDLTTDFALNDWSFSQLCRMAKVNKETINRLTPKTASLVLDETLPRGEKPLQVLTEQQQIRSVHGVSYTRLWNVELLDLVKEFASDFSPPQTAMDGHSTGLYCGEQDMFAFMIDPQGWAEIEGEAFAPGFFLWNSEVGRRSVGIQTFWFQRICQNHIVWDAVEVVEFTRKHTANVRESLVEIRRIIEGLVAKRDERRDRFVDVLRNAMVQRLGHDAEEVAKKLTQEGIPQGLIKESMEIARQQGGFTIFALVDALTKLSQRVQLEGDRVNRGELHRFTMQTGRHVYLTHSNSRLNSIEAPQDESQNFTRARELQRRFGCLLFCCESSHQRMRLTRDELKVSFPDLVGVRKKSFFFYVVELQGSKCLGVLHVDTSSTGKWDRGAIRFAQELHRLQRMDCIQELSRVYAFESTIVTALQPKATRIAKRMESLSATLTVPVRCVAIPALLDLATLTAI